MVTTLLHPPARILVACDKFKGSLDAAGACAAIADGLARRFPEALIETRPIADGGEGFTASLDIPLCGQWVEVSAHVALGRPVTARYLLASAADGPLAVMEMAEASGMWRIAPDERDVLRASTFGTCCKATKRCPLVNIDSLDGKLIDIGALVVLCICNCRFDDLAYHLGCLLGCEGQYVQSFVYRFPPYEVSNQTGFLCRQPCAA
jgi:hypothetical protein